MSQTDGLLLTLDGVEKKPSKMTDEKWESLNLRAIGIIELCLSDDLLFEESAKTAAEYWKLLEERFMKKNLSNKLNLKRQLYMLRMKENTPFIEHLSVFNKLIADLTQLEDKMEDVDKAMLLLTSLPDSYENLVNTIIYGKDSLVLEEVKGTLISYDARKNSASSSSEKGEGLIAAPERGRTGNKGRSNGRGRSKSKGRSFECFFCKKVGHMKRDCRAFKESLQKGKDGYNSASVVEEKNEVDVLTVCAAGIDKSSSGWILDTGASFHMCPDKEWFTSYEPLKGGIVVMGNDAPCTTVGIGSVQFKMFDGCIRTLTGVRHVPELKKNLISLGELDTLGWRWSGGDGKIKVTHGAMTVIKGTKVGNLYWMQGNAVAGKGAANVARDEDSTALWHMRLGHMSEKGLCELHKQGLLKGVKSCKLDFCKYCVFGKQHRIRFKTAIHKTKEILEYVHSDVWGPAQVRSKGGAEYFVTFIDDFSRKVWVYFLKNKFEVLDKFKAWKAQVEKSTGKFVKYLRTDNGGEYTSREFASFCEKEGVTRHFTTPRSPEQNGVAERMNRTLCERARSMRLHANLSKDFWAEAVDLACYLVNISPSSALELKTPQEVWTGELFDYSRLRIFGCKAYALVDETQRSKLDSKSKECIFLGYDRTVKGYKLWDPVSKKVLLRSNVVFDETSLLKGLEEKEQQEDPMREDEIEVEVTTSRGESNQETQQETNDSQVEEEAEQESIAQGRQRRITKAPVRYGHDDASIAFALVTECGDPCTFEEAIEQEDRNKWMVAMTEEMESLHKNQTWELTELPKGKRAIGCKWIFRKKEGSSPMEEIKYKARLVAKGYAQKEGVDYNEIFSPVVKHTSIRVLLAMVAMDNMELEQMDVKTAFLHGHIEEEIYMKQPDGFIARGKEGQVCKLKKSLYGLKQSPRQWYKRFDLFMINNGFVRCDYDSCVYLRSLGDGTHVFLLLYVDDMLIAAKEMKHIDDLKLKLHGEFEMKDLGSAKKILGMEISRDTEKGEILLTQRSYIRKILERYNLENAKQVATPISAHFKLSLKCSPSTEKERRDMERVPYASAVGSVMYAMICTRPDISHAVSLVSRYMANPGKEHWEALKWLLRYLKGTMDVSLKFTKDGAQRQVEGYVDSDYAGDLDKRRSTTGYVFTLGGGPVSWRSVLQHTTALSTTEAEYMAAVDAGKEAIWLKGLVSSLGMEQEVTKLHCDSQSAIYLAKDQTFHSRTKHIEVRYHKIREWIEEGQVVLQKIDTSENPADMMTKVVNREKFELCSKLLNVLRK